MPSPLRDESPGYHHVWCRGNNKRLIVVDDLDRLLLLGLIESVAREFQWGIAAYCLMDNHYHLVIEIGERGMSDGFCRLNTAYATRFNRRHGRINHLFGARYGSKPLRDQASLVNTCRYVVRNPVRDGIVERPEDYPWSSYRATIGLADPDITLSTTELLAAFERDLRRARIAFADFVRTPTLAERAEAASVKNV
jgi:putative transposase